MEVDGHSDPSTSSDEDDEDWEWIQILFAVLMAAVQSATTTHELFHPAELEFTSKHWVDQTIGVHDRLTHMQASPSYFKTLTNFTTPEFEELCHLVVPTITAHARHTGVLRKKEGRPSKLQPAQRLLSFILYLRHANSVSYDAFDWNWSQSSLCDDALFVASCLNEAISNEICWPSIHERRHLATMVPKFPGCIGIIDGTLVKIRRPKDTSCQRMYYNGRKKIHSLNSTVIVDNQGMIIHLDLGYPGSMHDITILKHSEIDKNWRHFFTHDPPYLEYLLGDPGYIGNDRYIMRRIGHKEIAPAANLPAIDAFNKLHAGYRVQVEWGIGGIKRKWQRLSTRFDNIKNKFHILFYAGALLTNFLHRRRRDYTFEVFGERGNDGGQWDGDL